VFHVKVGVEVVHSNREIEFFELLQRLNSYIRQWENKTFTLSCEMIASDVLSKFNAVFVEVDEDGENGARVERDSVSVDGIRTKCFVGFEAEGPHRGSCVLFVPGKVTPSRLHVVMQKLSGDCIPIQRIYYGAGNDHELSHHVLLFLKSLTFPVDVEGADLKKRFGDIFNNWKNVTLIGIDEADGCDFKKWTNDNVIIWKHSDGLVYVTSRRDPIFTADFDVE